MAQWWNWQTRRPQTPVSSDVRVQVPPGLPTSAGSLINRHVKDQAPLAELVDALDLGSSVFGRGGSTPSRGTRRIHRSFFLRNVAQSGSALGLGPRRRGFESLHSDQGLTGSRRVVQATGSSASLRSSVGRATASYAVGRGFESRRSHRIQEQGE